MGWHTPMLVRPAGAGSYETWWFRPQGRDETPVPVPGQAMLGRSAMDTIPAMRQAFLSFFLLISGLVV